MQADTHHATSFAVATTCKFPVLQLKNILAVKNVLFPSANVSKKLTKRRYCSLGKMCPFDLIYVRPDIIGS